MATENPVANLNDGPSVKEFMSINQPDDEIAPTVTPTKTMDDKGVSGTSEVGTNDAPIVSPEKEEEEEKKEDAEEEEEKDPKSPPRKSRVSLTAEAFDNPTNNSSSDNQMASPTSHKRTHTGLSELSKQLRVLQAKNQYLQSEMERCQRQLKIMSESKGVSVVDMMKSLESACAMEAHAELQSQITSLKAQLEALQMSGKGATGTGGSSPGRSSAVSKSQALQQDSLKQQVASLQLQLGEYEELEQNLKTEMKSLYDKVNTHQSRALTLEATSEQQHNLLESARNRTAELEAQVAALTKERDALKDQQAQQLSQYWAETLDQHISKERNHDEEKKIEDSDAIKAAPKPSYTNSVTPEQRNIQRSVSDRDLKTMTLDANAEDTHYGKHSFLPFGATLKRSMSDNALEITPDAKATVTKYFKPSILPSGSAEGGIVEPANNGTHVQSTAKPNFIPSVLPRPMLERSLSDPSLVMIPDAKSSITTSFTPSQLYGARNSQFFVQQRAKTMDLETLCRHQQNALQLLQEDQSKERAHMERIQQERDAAQAKRALYEQKIFSLELDLRLEREQCQSLRSQLSCREEEFSLKKDQLQSRLQVHQERTKDVEGQLSSLYVAFELLQQDRSEEHVEQAELRSRLIDADSQIAQQIQGHPQSNRGEAVASSTANTEVNLSSEGGPNMPPRRPSLRQRAGMAMPSPKRNSRKNIFSKGDANQELPPAPPLTTTARRASSGSIPPLPPSPRATPASTVHQGYLLKQQSKKKTFLGGDKGAAWKQKYVVLKKGQGSRTKGSYCFWYGDAPLAKVKGTIPHVIQGVSTATFGGNPERPLSFVISINPRDPDAPVAGFEALSAEDLQIWESVLKDALDVDYNELTHDEQRRADLQVALAVGKKYAT